MTELNGIDFTYPPTIIFQADEQWRFGREPVLRRMSDGSLACLIFSGGPREPDDDNCVLITRSQDDGETWHRPELLFAHPARGAWATEIFTEGPQPLAFVHTFATDSIYTEIQAFISTTSDAGNTWTAPVSIPGGGKSISVRQGILLADGTWLFPCYWQEVRSGWQWERGDGHYQPPAGDWRFCSGVLRSTDQGASYTLHGYLQADCNLWEPNVVELAPGHLLMYIRASGKGYLYESRSDDGGLTWSPARATDIPNADTKVTLLRRDNAVLMLNNPNPHCGFGNRTPLSLWVSFDKCETWPIRIDLARILPHAEGEIPEGLPDCWPTAICYPHAFIDEAQGLLYVACDAVHTHYLMKIPLSDIFEEPHK